MRLNRLTHFSCIATQCLLTATARADDAGVVAKEWSSAFGGVSSIELQCALEIPVFPIGDTAGKLMAIDSDIACVWPVRLRVRTSVPRSIDQAPFFLDRDSNEQRIITDLKQQYFVRGSPGKGEFFLEPGVFSLDQDSVVFGQACSVLAGKWLGSIGLPQELARCRFADPDTVEVELIGFSRTLVLQRDVPVAGKKVFVLSKVLLKAGDQLVSTETFEDFRTVNGIGVPVGHRKWIDIENDEYKAVGRRSEQIISLEIGKNFEPSVFVKPSSAFRDVSRRPTISATDTNVSAPITAEAPPAPYSRPQGASERSVSLWTLAGTFLIAAAGYLFYKTRSR